MRQENMFLNEKLPQSVEGLALHDSLVKTIENLNKYSYFDIIEQLNLDSLLNSKVELQDIRSFNQAVKLNVPVEKFLTDKFVVLRLVNHMGMIPPYLIWVIQFENISLRIPKMRVLELALKDTNVFNHLEQTYGEEEFYQYTIPLIYNLSHEKFTISY